MTDILNNPEASENGKYVAPQSLRNSDVATKGIPPTCQDTGTVVIMSEKGQHVWADGGDETALAQGVYNTYIQDNLRYPQNAPLGMYEKVNISTNLPVRIDLHVTDDSECKFLCIARDDDSADKVYLYQETKVLITPMKLRSYLAEKIHASRTAACPPYHIAFVIGGISAEATLKIVKLTSVKYYDGLPTEGNEHGQAFRDMQLEQELLPGAQSLDLGARFGGKYSAHDIRAVCLPRHGAPCPVGMGISCPADRNARTRTNCDGIWVEKLESSPGRYIPEHLRRAGEGEAVKVNLNQPMGEVPALSLQYPVSARLSPSDTAIMARDIVHAKLKELIDSGGTLPQYVKDHPIYYAGPVKTPDSYASDSLGPITVRRMNSYADLLQSHGASKVILAKDNHSQQVTDTYHKHGGFYPGSIGGPVAVPAQRSTRNLECVTCPGLGMEAIWETDVEDFPVFILINDRGNDFLQQIQTS